MNCSHPNRRTSHDRRGSTNTVDTSTCPNLSQPSTDTGLPRPTGDCRRGSGSRVRTGRVRRQTLGSTPTVAFTPSWFRQGSSDSFRQLVPHANFRHGCSTGTISKYGRIILAGSARCTRKFLAEPSRGGSHYTVADRTKGSSVFIE